MHIASKMRMKRRWMPRMLRKLRLEVNAKVVEVVEVVEEEMHSDPSELAKSECV